MADEAQQNQPTQPEPDVPRVQALKLSLDAVKAEYEAEHERSRTYEGRTGVLLTLAGALFAFEGTSFVLPKSNVPYKTAGMVVAMQMVALFVLLASMVALIQVITIRTFHRIDLEECRGDFDTFDDVPAHGILREMYYLAITRTSDAIKVRTTWFRVGIWLLMSGIVFVTLARILAIYSS